MSEFQNLKFKNQTPSKFKSMRQPTTWSRSPGVSSSDVKGNEAERKVRCKICGFICDRERDVRMPEDSYAGLGISYGVQLTAGTCIADRINSSGVTSADQYYNRDVRAGCPHCGSFLYDPTQPAQEMPDVPL